MTLYRNNNETRAKLGWWNVPQYCVGDFTAKYVIHDEKRGLFLFTDSKNGLEIKTSRI